MLAEQAAVPEWLHAGDVLAPTGELLASAEDVAITLPPELVEDLAQFDRLPRPLRWALQEAVLCWRAEPFVQLLKPLAHDFLGTANAIVLALREITAEENLDLRAFAAQYRRRYGTQLPHVAAAATVQRYGRR